MTKFKDVAHLYLGCECIIGDPSWESQNISPEDVAPYTDPNFGKPIKTVMGLETIQHHLHHLKPILRPLGSMTEEEHEQWKGVRFSDKMKLYPLYSDNDFNSFKWLLSKHFDLFDLIPNGEAIDKAKNN